MSYLPTLRQLQFLLALKEHGRYQDAARACHVTQSTLSAGIMDMEALLGQKVVDRSNRRRLIFTPVGLRLLDTAQQVINQLTLVTAQAQKSQEPFAWPLKVGLIPTIAPYWLPRILAPLQAKFPQLKLHIHEMQSAALVEAIEAGELDCGILALPFQTQALEVMPLFKESFMCAAPHQTFGKRKNVTLQDLEKHPLLLLSDGHCLRDHMLSACGLRASQHQQNISATSLATIIQLVAHGYGVTLLPEMAVQSGSVPDTIAIKPFTPTATREISLIWRARSMLEKDIVLLGRSLKKQA